MESNPMPRLIAAGESHKGCVRADNEDSFCLVSLQPDYLLAVVADGVGGYSGGEEASYLCCHRLLMDWKELFKRNAQPSDALLSRFAVESICRANSDIYRANLERKYREFMCTTVAMAVFSPQMVIVSHAGDSRVYCLHNHHCRQLTVDHTVQNYLTEQGIINDTNNPGAHVISKAVGAVRTVKPEIHTYFRSPEDRYMLCTDGLSNTWRMSDISHNLNSSASPRSATDRFIKGSLRRGAGDNVTVVCVFPENTACK